MAPIISRIGFNFGFGKKPGAPKPFFATGGTKTTPGDGYVYHTFTGSSTLQVSGTPATVEYLLIGGGGYGGWGGDSTGGGGGGGGVVYNPSFQVNAGNYTLVVGGTDTSSTGFGVTALGGGSGGNRSSQTGLPGGSGGGGGYFDEFGFGAGTGIQPSQNPGIPGIVQYGQPGYPYNAPGGSSNATNNRNINVTFPNSSTILSGSPIGPQAIARGGVPGSFGAPSDWPATSYGSGGKGGQNSYPGVPNPTAGKQGAIIVRYPTTA